MAHINATAPSASVFARFQNVFEDVKEKQTLYAEYRRTFKELDDLSDRELSDIGVDRANIRAIAHEHVYGK